MFYLFDYIHNVCLGVFYSYDDAVSCAERFGITDYCIELEGVSS